MAEFSLRIVASDKVFYGGPSEIVIVPALDGEYGFMAHHDDMVVAMKPGELRFEKAGRYVGICSCGRRCRTVCEQPCHDTG